MGKTIEEILSENKSLGEYTEQDTKKAQNEINNFLNRLKQLKVIEENGERPLNQLEQFLYIYEFVSNRVYEDVKTSHDIIGVLNTNKAGLPRILSFITIIMQSSRNFNYI